MPSTPWASRPKKKPAFLSCWQSTMPVQFHGYCCKATQASMENAPPSRGSWSAVRSTLTEKPSSFMQMPRTPLA